MKNKFKINKKSKLLIYGAVANGQKLCNIFVNEGYTVIGFIDKRAHEIKQTLGLPVWTVENIPISEEVVVIITIKNVFEHCKIVKELTIKGIYNIIYCPQSLQNIISNNVEYEKIKSIYNKIINLKDIDNSIEIKDIGLIPKTYDIKLYKFKDYAIIDDNIDNMLIVNLPIEMIYTAQKKNGFCYNWAEKNILTLPHISLFEYFDGKNSTYKDQYMDFCIYTAELNNITITESWKENILNSRNIVYSEMCKSLELNSDFFIKNAQIAIWNNEYGYFNLNGGRHRASFFCEKNYEFMPLKVNMMDYDSYLNYRKLDDVINFIIDNNINEVYSPVSHPYFYRFPCKKKRYMNLIIKPITRFISNNMLNEFKKLDFHNLTFLHIGDDEGAIKRHFSKMGCNTIGYGKCTDFESLLNDLFYSRNIDYVSFGDLKTYDFVYINEEHKILEDKLINYILNNTNKYIFIEFNRYDYNCIKQRMLSLNKNYRYLMLNQFYFDNHSRELGVVYFVK